MKKSVVLLVMLFAVASGSISAEEVRWIPVAASNPGDGGTMWTTELWVLNRVKDGPIDVHIAFLPDADGVASPAEVTVEVPPSRSIHIQDVVGTLFNENLYNPVTTNYERLAAGKTTLVRVYADVRGTEDPIPDVNCRLHAFDASWEEMEGSPIFPVDLVTLDPDETWVEQRQDVSKSFNFFLPQTGPTAMCA